MVQLPLEYQSGDTLLADLNPDYYITDKKKVVAKLTANNAWTKPIQRIAPIDFIELSDTKFKELNKPYEDFQAFLSENVQKHLPGQHDQSSHGNRRSAVSPTVVSDTQRLTADWGGLSINMVDGSMPTAGFMVAKPPEFSKVVDAKDFFDADKGPKILADYMKTNKKDLASGKNYLGTWLFEGKVYLDVSENIMDRAEAKRLGQERNQLAIYDVVAGDSIDTGGTGSVGKRSQYGSNQRYIRNDRQRGRRLRSGTLGKNDSGEVEKHLPGQHDQSTHGGRKSYKSIDDLVNDGMDIQATVEELGTYSAADGNVAMRVLLERVGKGGTPELVASVDDLDGDPFYRGAADVTNESFKTNDYDRIGVGQYGDGYYFSDNKITANDYAQRAARDKTYGNNKADIMTAGWKKDAKVYVVGESMNWLDVSVAAQNKAIDKLNVNTRASDDEDAIFNLFFSDYGNAFATDLILQGYDGMNIDIGLSETYTVVFNREALQVVSN
jgi:hypothetical protein